MRNNRCARCGRATFSPAVVIGVLPFGRLMAYCQQDVRVERELHSRLMPLSATERKVWLLDYKINQQGVAIDVPSARAAVKLAEVVKAEFHEVVDYKQLAETLAAIPLVKERIKAIEAFAYTEALAGRFGEAHGYKVVDKRPMRKWKSEGDVVEWAQANGIDPWEKTVISPAAMEEKLKANAPRGKKKEAGAAIEPLVEKVSSGTVLVPVSDNRPPAQLVTKDDFAVIDEARG